MIANLSAKPSTLVPSGTEFSLDTRDGYPLAARLWARSSSFPPAFVCVINGGAGIASSYYDRFAGYLASGGVPTLVYDYRGVGRSRPKNLRGFRASIEDWGSKDCAAALEWLSDHFPTAKRVVVGHSIGGFVTGFVTNGRLVDRMLLIGAHTAYWRDYAAAARPWMYLLWHAFMPAVTTAVGYFPGRRLHLMEDLPAGIAMEWAGRRRPEFWSKLRLADGSPDVERIKLALAGFRALRASTLAIRIEDDPFGTAAATDRILSLYENCHAARLSVGPDQADGQAIGHFGFFRPRFRKSLWPRALRWMTGLE